MAIESAPAGRADTVRAVDGDFLALPLREVAAAALEAARAGGAEHADVRVHRIRSAALELRDARVVSSSDTDVVGLAVRVLRHGVWGFAAHVDLTPPTAAATARRALDVAATLAPVARETVTLAAEPVHADATWVSPYVLDPFAVDPGDRIGLLTDRSAALLAAPGVDHVEAVCLQVKEQTFYADLAGTVTTQQRVRVDPGISVTAVDRDGGGFETMRTLAPPVGRGWEFLRAREWDWDTELAELPELLAEKLAAPSVDGGPLRPRGRPVEPLADHPRVDRPRHRATTAPSATRRPTPARPSPPSTSSGRCATARPSCTSPATARCRTAWPPSAIDDEGRPPRSQSFDLVRDGMLVGYQLDRSIAAAMGLDRSNGCAFADSPHARANPAHGQRLAGPGRPGRPEHRRPHRAGWSVGIYVVGDKSWSIDMQRYNFQFTGQRFYRIERRASSPASSATSPTRPPRPSSGAPWRRWAASRRGCSAEPSTAGRASRARWRPVATAARRCSFRGVNVLNTREEAGR